MHIAFLVFVRYTWVLFGKRTKARNLPYVKEKRKILYFLTKSPQRESALCFTHGVTVTPRITILCLILVHFLIFKAHKTNTKTDQKPHQKINETIINLKLKGYQVLLCKKLHNFNTQPR